MQLFYHSNAANTGDLITFDKDESRHITRVLRKSEGDQLYITDGVGTLYKARLIESNVKRCSAEIFESSFEPSPRPYRLHIAIAPTKTNDRLEWFLEKATEIGIDEISPIVCQHSERSRIKTERMEKVLISAMKQSLKFMLPVLNPLSTFEELVDRDHKGAKLIAHCNSTAKVDLAKGVSGKDDILVLIGPEGDFSTDEIDAADKAGFQSLDLGKSRLRTETAGVVVCSNIALLKEFL